MAEALPDLGLLLLWSGAFILASLAVYLAQALASVIDIDLPLIGRPFHGIAVAFQNAIVHPLDSVRKKAENGVTTGFSDLVQSLELAIGLTLLLGLAVKLALSYLWNHALEPFVKLLLKPAEALLHTLQRDLAGFEAEVAVDFSTAYTYIDDTVASATGTIESTLRRELKSGVAAAEGYADTAVATLRTAETAALTAAVSALNEGIAAAKRAEDAALGAAVTELEAGLTAAEQLARQEVAQAEAVAASALAQADGIIDASIAGVKSIAVTVEDDLSTLIGNNTLLGAAGLIAAIPLLSTLVSTIATETGLDNQACRQKVKGICATDPTAWANLLGGLAVLGFAFSLKDLYGIAEPLVGELASVIEQAA